MKKWNTILDVALCQGCHNCFLACKDEFFENNFPPFSKAQPRHGQFWMNIKRKERGQYPKVDVAYLPIACMQCDAAPCVKQSKDGAVYKRDDGIVIIDPEKSKNCKSIVDSCPYNAISWNEEENIPQKCTFCIHLLEEGWQQPRCVQACPTEALQVFHLEDKDMEKRIKSENLSVLHPEYKTGPRVYYKNLFRYTQCFIAGSIALKDTDECAENAVVKLFKEPGEIVHQASTNNYGDFKLDALTKESGPFTLEVAFPDYETKTLNIEITESKNLGTIFIDRQ